MDGMDFRHEWKIEITPVDRLALRRRLLAVARLDGHAAGGAYRVRSLYFDTPGDRALREKLDGVSRREKFRLRYYNGDASALYLEKKSKLDSLCRKESAPVAAGEAQAILEGRYGWMAGSGRDLVWELHSKLTGQLLRPKVIVDYTREPFVYGPGNVRVTLDYGIRMGLDCAGFLNPGCVTIPASGDPVILEVKWDAFLPDIIRDAVQLPGRRAAAFSKYAACRQYG